MPRPKKRNPWNKLMENVRLVAKRHGSVQLGENNAEWLKARERRVTITAQYLQYQFRKQGKKCYWLGIPLDPQDVFKIHDPASMSVDRLNNKKGYIRGNIVICCRFANLGRGRSSVESTQALIALLKSP